MSTAALIEPKQHGRVLVVDDEPRNRDLLRDLLAANGYSIVEAEDGIGALAKAVGQCDVILLDVMMPRMDGLEACRQLKSNPETAHIPVLMVSALAERDQRHEGIEAGANDYLTKPIDRREVLLRVRNAVDAKRLHDRVQAELARIRELEAQKENLTQFLVHDMRSPLMVIMGELQLTIEAGRIAGDDKTSLDMALGATQRLTEMVGTILDVNRMESHQLPLYREPCDVVELAREAAGALGPLGAFREVEIRVNGTAMPAILDKGLIVRVFANLIGNAVKFSPNGTRIEVTVSRAGGAIRAEVTDRGPGIPPEYHARIFDKFGQGENSIENKRNSSGLGLAFCKLAVEALGGCIGLHSAVGQGSTFWFELPAVQTSDGGHP